MFSRIRIAHLGLLVLAGCASQVMEGYVGESIQGPILDYGPPSNVVELDNGRRAYQWSMSNSGVVPMTTPSTTTAYGSGGYATAYSQSTTYVPYSRSCLYTLLAMQKGDEWIVTGYRDPTLGCE